MLQVLGLAKFFRTFILQNICEQLSLFVGNKVKGRISKRVFQKQSTPNFPKNEHFLHPGMHP